MTKIETCPGCLAEFSIIEPIAMTHPYIGASGSCWEMYSTHILAKEYTDPAYFKAHRVTVDTYGAQHIGDQTDRRARQSAWVHLIALYLKVHEQVSTSQVQAFLKKATEVKLDWPPLQQRQNPKWLTIQDVALAESPEAHEELVLKWGKSVCDANKNIHDEIIRLHNKLI
jgi:predicted protein tyrosine phosphatase